MRIVFGVCLSLFTIQEGVESKMTTKQYLVSILVIALFSVVSLTWFHGQEFIGGGDNESSMDVSKFLTNINAGWRAEINTGTREFRMQMHLPLAFYQLIEENFGFPPSIISHIRLFLSLFIPGVFMLLFLNRLFKNSVHFLAKLCASLFYVFNPYAMLQPLGIVTTKFPVYLSMPILGYFVLAIVEAKSLEDKFKYGLFLTICSVLSVGAFGNIAEVAALVVVLGSLAVFGLFTNSQRKTNLGVFLLVGVFAFLINFWWIYSSIYSQFFMREDFARQVANFDAGGTFVFDALRLFGFWALPSYFNKVLYYPFGELYYEFWVVVLTYIIPAVVFFPLIYVLLPKKRKDLTLNSGIKFALFLALMGIFLIKGRTGVLGSWYSYLYDNIPLFRIFREPFSKFTLINVFAYSLLVAAGLHLYYNLVKSKYKAVGYVVFGAFVTALVLISFPMFNGQIVNTYVYGQIKQGAVRVPEYWKEFNNYTAQKELDGRVLTLPKNDYYYKSFIWPSGFSGRPYFIFLDATAIYYNMVEPVTRGELVINELYDTIEKYLFTKDQTELNKAINLARILSVGNVLQMNDYDWLSNINKNIWARESVSVFYEALIEESVLIQEATFGFLSEDYLSTIPFISGVGEVYRFDEDADTATLLKTFANKPGLEWYSLDANFSIPRIYSPTKFYVYKDTADMFNLMGANPSLDEYPVYIDETVAAQDIHVSDKKLTVPFTKLSDAIYLVNLYNLDNRVLLVFNENFDAGWGIYQNCDLICTNPIFAKHILVNSYANAWVFDKDQLSGDTVYIVHEAETRLLKGVAVSVLSCGLLIVISIILYVKSNKKPKVGKKP